MSLDAKDLERLRRAIALAAKGRFRVEPNPPVGCVLVREGAVVGEGWHDGFGGAHAEVRALTVAGEASRGATAYVSLEPCSRHGKTPPCSDALVRAGVARVVYAAADPDPREGGRSAAVLRGAGIAVVGPALPDEGEALLHRFRGALRTPRPWVILKWAMSADGRTAPSAGAGGRLTGPRAEAEVHELRGRVDAVLVGHGTLRSDDPLLTCRLAAGPPDGRPQPLRVVSVGRLEQVEPRRLWDSTALGPVLVAAAAASPAARGALEASGVTLLELPGRDGRVDLARLLAELFRRGVRRLLVEGGARLHGALLKEGLADQVEAWVAPLVFGGPAAVPAVDGTAVTSVDEALHLAEPRWRKVGDDLVLEGYVGR
jgi:diaminohydroxyphosphoribosylaminopyrimidine deaminase/5-amino-6-(5-phosphoribosylamino)uracil reductase